MIVAIVHRHGKNPIRVNLPAHAKVNAETAERVSWHYAGEYQATNVEFRNGKSVSYFYRNGTGWEKGSLSAQSGS